MKYILGTAYINRPDLLYRAVYSVRPFWSNTIIIDNSESDFLKKDHLLPNPITVYEPPVRLGYSQMMNIMQKWAMEKDCDIILFMHSDAEVHPGTPDKFLSLLESYKRNNRRWGVALTNYDVLVAYNMDAVREVGPWDPVFYDYYADIDYYRRMSLAGYEIVYTNLGVTHQNGGQNTIRNDPYLNYVVPNVTFPMFYDYYQKKWGGKFMKETYHLPFNRFPLNPLNNRDAQQR